MGPSVTDLDAGNVGDGQSIRRVKDDDALGGYAVGILSEAFRTDVRNQLTVQIVSLPGMRNSAKSTQRRDMCVPRTAPDCPGLPRIAPDCPWGAGWWGGGGAGFACGSREGLPSASSGVPARSGLYSMLLPAEPCDGFAVCWGSGGHAAVVPHEPAGTGLMGAERVLRDWLRPSSVVFARARVCMGVLPYPCVSASLSHPLAAHPWQLHRGCVGPQGCARVP